jgi:hypothetical protein
VHKTDRAQQVAEPEDADRAGQAYQQAADRNLVPQR